MRTGYYEVDRIAAEQGWNEESLLILALGYIFSRGNPANDDGFIVYLEAAQAEENGGLDWYAKKVSNPGFY